MSKIRGQLPARTESFEYVINHVFFLAVAVDHHLGPWRLIRRGLIPSKWEVGR